MDSLSIRPAEVHVTSRRRTSSAQSTGFEYPANCRVEEDILSRIRALVLSRNTSRPPRTPHPSDERNPPRHENRAFGSLDDFLTPRKTARGARSESGLLSVELQVRKFHSSDGSMDIDTSRIQRSRQNSIPSVSTNRRTTRLRGSSSANDLRIDGGAADIDPSIDSKLLDTTSPKRNYFRLPKLVVRDIQEPNKPSSSKIAIASCLPTKNIYQKVPTEDTSDQDAKQPCPHCDQQINTDCPVLAIVDDKLSRFSTLPQSPPEAVKGQPEIACSPTCPPNCKEHYIYHPLPALIPRSREELFKLDISMAPEDMTNLDIILNDVKDQQALGQSSSSAPKSNVARAQNNMKSESSFITATITNPRDTEGSPPPTRGSSVSSVDTFPHVLTSEMAVDELVPRPLSSAVVTNFSLPGPKAKATISLSREDARQTAPKRSRSPSTGSIRAKPHTPSLLSGASRTSVRHSLLKPSVTAGTPVDTGLPVPPVLTPVTSSSDYITEKITTQTQVATPSLGIKIPLEPILADIAAAAKLSTLSPVNSEEQFGTRYSTLPQDKLVVEEISPSCIKLGYIDKSSPSVPLLTAVVTVPKKPQPGESPSGTSDDKPSVPERNEARTKSIADQKSVEEIQRQGASEAFPPVDPLNASYWGFVPAVKDAVQDAVKVAVRNAVQDIVVPPGIEKAEATDAYRMLVANSLAEAAKTADEYLRRDSLWIQAPPQAPEPAPELTPESMPDSSLDDKTAQISRIDFSPTQEKNKPLDLPPSPGEMEEIPLTSTSGNRRQESSKATTTIYDAIPPRDSSKNRVLKSKIRNANSSAALSQKDPSRRRGSREGLMSVADSTTNATSEDRTMNRKNTVHWLRELLSSNDAYAPRLTALPPRSRRAEALSESSGRQRSFTAPTAPIEELFLGATPSPLETKPKISFADPKSKAAVAATFTKTINDLEKLLNEALFIARQAAEKDDDNSVPNLLSNAAAILKGGRKFMDKERSSVPRRSRRKPGAEVVSSVESIPSAHESARSYSGTSTEGNTDDDEFTDDENMRQAPIPDVAPPEKQEITKTVNANLEISDQGFRGRERSTTWDSSRALNALDLPGSPKKQKPLTQRLSMPRPSTAGVSPSSNSIGIDFSPGNGNPEKPSRTTTSGGFGWQDISERQTVYQSPSLLQSQSGEEMRPGKQLYEEDAVTLAQLPVTTLRGKSSVSNSLDGSHPSETVDFQTGFHHAYIMQHVEGKGGPARNQPRSRLRSRAQSQFQQTAQGGEGRGVGEGEEDRDKVQDLREQRPALNRDGSNRSMNINLNMSHHFFNLQGKRHVSLKDHKGFSLARTHKRKPIARDWSPSRKRFTAIITCLSTFLVGLVIGIYAGEVPSIQYSIVDLHHFTVLGNVFFFLGLAIPTTFFWPLPLLHGRKPYILGSMSLAMPLLFPQALAVGATRNPKLAGWRIGLLLSRAFMGLALGFANMNFLSTLMDLFGASLQSTNPHQEYVDAYDVRRHGGGMGLWLGIWTWCYVGSIGVGFLLGAIIINFLTPAWGFYISIAILALVLVLNVVSPEVRRSAFRRSVTEVRKDDQVSRRLAKGEVKMHRVHTGPKWWGEEFHHGLLLTKSMMHQPGFLVLAFYQAWIYGQIILIMILLGSLTSKYYKFKSPFVGASVASIPLGALLSVPFQKAGIFSRERKEEIESDDDTLKRKKISLSSHFVRRSIFVILLPFMGLAYTLSSTGPPVPFMLPIIWAAAIGFLSNLAVAECNGIIMETFDTSDLQPGMTGRPRSGSKGKVTNYSCFPRVCAAFGITQGMGFCIAAMASGIGGVAQRHLGQQAATGVMCGVLLILSVLLICVLARFQDVQIIPESKTSELERYQAMKREQYIQGNTGNGGEEEEWKPIIIGNPTHIMRRMSVLELGSMTRWSEIRKKNRLIDEQSLEARHANLNTLVQVEKRLKEKRKHVVDKVRRSLSGSRDGGDDVREYSYEEKITTRKLVPGGGGTGGEYGDERMDFREDRMGKVTGNTGMESRGGDVKERDVTMTQRSRGISQVLVQEQGDLGGLREIDLGVPEGRGVEIEEEQGGRSRGGRSRMGTKDSAREREGYDPRLRRGTLALGRGEVLGEVTK
ncbi:hypothetical protein MFRU_008g00980 [Monilinia fructicola]|uniref:Uncharacterized protein n=1 Tax=Monilinia fructicola TaxID=38448 RepID=A0A5M9JB29_MONFR|nr:hypothetical protein EYC84_010842 [Monilinia fructicola]KAG4031736.1 hypothetical protein MFRU_008g00980 [Monilinia fructicola]